MLKITREKIIVLSQPFPTTIKAMNGTLIVELEIM